MMFGMNTEPELIYFLEKPIHVVRKFRAKRLTLSMRPDRPMRLTSSLSTSKAEILDFLRSHESWIRKNYEKIKALEDKYQKPSLENGALFPFLGELKYFTFAVSTLVRQKPWFAIEDGFLMCYLPRGTSEKDFSPELLENLLHNFYKKQGIEYLELRMPLWVERTGLVPAFVKYNRANTRWGSCNSKKQINMNWKLICHAPHLVDYVIVHELCHIKHMNHSEHFWSLVGHFMPEYQVYEKILDEQVSVSRFLNVSN